MQGTLHRLNTEGTEEIHHVTEMPDLEVFRKAVGGDIEIVPRFTRFAGKPCVVFCNEEGKLRQLPYNHRATIFWKDQLGGIAIDDVLVGNVLIVYGDAEFMREL